MFRLSAILGLIAVLVLMPQLDQVVCGFCGPSVETSAVGVKVGLADQECPLNDTVERASSNSDETDHIHLCTLHSTHLMATDAWTFFVQDVNESLPLGLTSPYPAVPAIIDHPPQLA